MLSTVIILAAPELKIGVPTKESGRFKVSAPTVCGCFHKPSPSGLSLSLLNLYSWKERL